VGEAYNTYGENRNAERILCGKSEAESSEDIGPDGRMLLKLI